MKTAWTTEKFIEMAKLKHRDVYDYSQVKYVKNILPVKIVCKHHGVFEQSPHNHLKGRGCKFCANNVNITTNEFIDRAKKIHGDKYDYSLVKYTTNRDAVQLICKVHGIFFVLPTNHLKGVECELCAVEMRAFNQRLSLSEFIYRSNIAHNKFYNYDKVIMQNTKIKVVISCPKHGDFNQIPETHMKGVGCPKCRMSKGELEIIKQLESNNIVYEYQKRFHDCKHKSYLVFDFYIPSKNVCIEFDGQQHHTAVPYFGGHVELEKRVIRDNIKNKYCDTNNIRLIRVKDIKKVSKSISEIL